MLSYGIQFLRGTVTPRTFVRSLLTRVSCDVFSSTKPISNLQFKYMMEQCEMNPYANNKLIVALSGGPDSMALLSLLKDWTDNSRLVAVTIDHGFREESSKEAESVHDWVSSMNIRHIIKKIDWTLLPKQQHLEKEGREQRYKLLNEVCSQYHTSDVIVAHHGDDQIETFFMRLFRGSGVSGLGCMKQIQVMDDGTRRIRPLLMQSKASLLATCKERSVPFVIDSSNYDLQYDRNRVRHGVKLLKEQGLLQGPAILETISYFQEIREGMERETSRQLIECCQYNKDLGICRLDLNKLITLPQLFISSILRTVCIGIGGASSPSERAIQRIVDTLIHEKGIKKPMQVAGCIISELKLGSSAYVKRQKNVKWACVCLDRNQLPQRSIDINAVPLPIDQQVCYIGQYLITVHSTPTKSSDLMTLKLLPFIDKLEDETSLMASFLSDPMLQGILCNNRGLLTRRNLSDIIARSIPAVFATINGKRELVYSTVLNVNRVKNLSFSMKAVPKPLLSKCTPWVIY